MVHDRRPRRLLLLTLSLSTVVALAAACGRGAATGSPPRVPSPPATTRTAMAVDTRATPPGWVPVAFADIQVSVPATWDIVFGCPQSKGNVYLGGIPKLFCPSEAASDIVALGTDASPPPAVVAPGIINGMSVYRLDPSGHSILIPSLHASVSASGPLATQVVDTVTYAPRAVALTAGASPALPAGWHRVSFGGLSAAVPRTWAIERRNDVPFDCDPITLSLSTINVVLSSGTAGSAVACPAISRVGIPNPSDGLVIDPGPIGPIPPDASFGPCLPIHGLRVCPTTNDRYSVLVFSVHLPGRSRPTTVEIGAAGSGLIARTILDSLEPG